ncbi:MAG TPA: hypothetical protein VNX26_14265 [Candidatus Acidoferrum sp.]|nr:hypothetical protein [Candidatus Acidoferrum sp.]
MADIRHAIQIAAPPASIFPLVSTAHGWSQWWAADVSEAAGAIELGFFKRTTLYRLKPLLNESPTHSEWLVETGAEWSGTRLIFHLDAITSGTNLRFTHADWRSETEYFVNCTTTWGELMFRLKAAAEGKPRGPLFLADSLAC